MALTSPGVGVWRLGPSVGAALLSTAGDDVSCGVLSVLGVDHRLVLPPGVAGRVRARLFAHEREPNVDYGARLLELSAPRGRRQPTRARARPGPALPPAWCSARP
jgi:hypothetical protein